MTFVPVGPVMTCVSSEHALKNVYESCERSESEALTPQASARVTVDASTTAPVWQAKYHRSA